MPGVDYEKAGTVMKFSLPTAFGKKVSLVIGLVVLSAFQAQAFDKVHLLKLKALNACEDCDLRAANLTGGWRPRYWIERLREALDDVAECRGLITRRLSPVPKKQDDA